MAAGSGLRAAGGQRVLVVLCLSIDRDAGQAKPRPDPQVPVIPKPIIISPVKQKQAHVGNAQHSTARTQPPCRAACGRVGTSAALAWPAAAAAAAAGQQCTLRRWVDGWMGGIVGEVGTMSDLW